MWAYRGLHLSMAGQAGARVPGKLGRVGAGGTGVAVGRLEGNR